MSTALADFFAAQAEWRRQEGQQHPGDERNLQSARALDALASYVSEPQVEGFRLLAELELYLFGGRLGGARTQREVARYGHGYEVGPSQHGELLEELPELCIQDAYEFALEHDGEDPTQQLFDFEVEAARDGVTLSRDYWRLRGSDEDEDAIEAYREEQFDRKPDG
jgi:hypothetical protein